MANKARLRKDHVGMVLNRISFNQEKALGKALSHVCSRLEEAFPQIRLVAEPQWFLHAVVGDLAKFYPDIGFHCHFDSSSMKPDGGIISIIGDDGRKYPILITEKKNQGTNDLRIKEGKKRQAKGNAIERLGKNVIGFRAAMLKESIFPFVCFGDGCDFAEESSILDRVSTIAMFGELNKECLHNLGVNGAFNRGTFYFRESPWTVAEMTERCYSIAQGAVYYYFSKYKKSTFVEEIA
jgi:Phosphatidylinositol kinase and protein kinases of the PI-3 kinase family